MKLQKKLLASRGCLQLHTLHWWRNAAACGAQDAAAVLACSLRACAAQCPCFAARSATLRSLAMSYDIEEWVVPETARQSESSPSQHGALHARTTGVGHVENGKRAADSGACALAGVMPGLPCHHESCACLRPDTGMLLRNLHWCGMQVAPGVIAGALLLRGLLGRHALTLFQHCCCSWWAWPASGWPGG